MKKDIKENRIFSREENVFISLANRTTRRSFLNLVAKTTMITTAASLATFLDSRSVSAITCCQTSGIPPSTAFCACASGYNSCPDERGDDPNSYCTGGFWYTCPSDSKFKTCTDGKARVYRDCGGRDNIFGAPCYAGCQTAWGCNNQTECGSGNKDWCCHGGYFTSGCLAGSNCRYKTWTMKNFCVKCQCCDNITC